jgi:uncharacterized membrane protein YkoI
MNKVFINLLLGFFLAQAALTDEAVAGPCNGAQWCDLGPAAFAKAQRFGTNGNARRHARQQRREQRRIEILNNPSYDSGDRFVQSEPEGNLIGPTEALTQALAAVPDGKPLGVKLLRGPAPVYAVKLRVGGKVRRILVDAQTAQVLGEN